MIHVNKHCVLLLAVTAGIVLMPPKSDAQNRSADLPDAPSHSAGCSAAENGSAAEREVTWVTSLGDFLRDQKAIWLFPAQLAKGHHWVPSLAIVGGTAGLIGATHT